MGTQLIAPIAIRAALSALPHAPAVTGLLKTLRALVPVLLTYTNVDACVTAVSLCTSAPGADPPAGLLFFENKFSCTLKTSHLG